VRTEDSGHSVGRTWFARIVCRNAAASTQWPLSLPPLPQHAVFLRERLPTVHRPLGEIPP
jgi:hypothetical protein